jgi:hypothetical protein
MAVFLSGLLNLKRLNERLGKRTIGNANRACCVTLGGLVGAAAAHLCPHDAAGCAGCAVVVFFLISAGAAVGQLCSLFTLRLVRRFPPRDVLAWDKFEERVRGFQRLPLPREEIQALIKKELCSISGEGRPQGPRPAARDPAGPPNEQVSCVKSDDGTRD